jgi:hypothetical protein
MACGKEPLGRTLFDGCTTLVEVFGGLWKPVCYFVLLRQYDVVCACYDRAVCDNVETSRRGAIVAYLTKTCRRM